MKSTGKQKSITTDTRLSHSHVLNTSSLNNTHLQQIFEPKENYFVNNIQNSENKEVEFLRHKNRQLQTKVKRMTKQILDLQQNKMQLLDLNKKYVNVVNRYYENCNKKAQRRVSEEGRVLQGLQRDHRNLVKHCLVMQGEIKNYTMEMEKFEEQKSQLKQANHTSVAEMLQELLDLSTENKQLKKQNNRITYELQKKKMQHDGLKKAHNQVFEEAGNSGQEISKMRSFVNTIKQESLDRSNAYEARIYELQVKVEKLEKQLRRQQQCTIKETVNKRNLQINQVQFVHEKSKLQKSLADLLNPRERGKTCSRMNLNRTSHNLVKKSNRQRKSLLGKSFDIS